MAARQRCPVAWKAIATPRPTRYCWEAKAAVFGGARRNRQAINRLLPQTHWPRDLKHLEERLDTSRTALATAAALSATSTA